MSPICISDDAMRRALALRDLTDPDHGPHALQLILQDAIAALLTAWGCPLRLRRHRPVVSIADNYDCLHYPPDGAARQARYTRYVTATTLLRTQTSAMIPGALRELAIAPCPQVLLACPGLTYRRDAIDALHCAEPHQVDLWRISQGVPLGLAELQVMARTVVEAVAPGRDWRMTPTEHPYTLQGHQLDVLVAGDWIEIGECGLALPQLLQDCHLEVPPTSGLAMGLGLDRLLMLRKGVPDIRLLRSPDPRVVAQMLDLQPYRPVSCMPPMTRDLSLVLDGLTDAELLGDAIREALGERANWVEQVSVLAQVPCEQLPANAQARLGILPGQLNAVVRVVLRDLERTLTVAEGNRARDDLYARLHRGTRWEWITPRAAPEPRAHGCA